MVRPVELGQPAGVRHRAIKTPPEGQGTEVASQGFEKKPLFLIYLNNRGKDFQCSKGTLRERTQILRIRTQTHI